MLRKKLLTIACVVGILACGACFMPSPNQSPPVRPPIPISPPKRTDLSGIRMILVEVTNTSGTHHVDPQAFSRMIASVYNEHTHPLYPRAYTQGAPKPDDAVLQVTIMKEITGPEMGVNAQKPPRQLFDLFMD